MHCVYRFKELWIFLTLLFMYYTHFSITCIPKLRLPNSEKKDFLHIISLEFLVFLAVKFNILVFYSICVS